MKRRQLLTGLAAAALASSCTSRAPSRAQMMAARGHARNAWAKCSAEQHCRPTVRFSGRRYPKLPRDVRTCCAVAGRCR